MCLDRMLEKVYIRSVRARFCIKKTLFEKENANAANDFLSTAGLLHISVLSLVINDSLE